MKKILLLAAAVFTAVLVNAQAGGYLFSQQLGTYTPVTGSFVLSNCTNNNLNTDTSTLVTLPQSFTFADTAYSTIRVGKGGWITFGSANPLNADAGFYKAGFNETHGTGGIIRALSLEWLTPSNGAVPCSTNVQTALVGNEFVVQWTDFNYEERPFGFGFMRFWHINVQVRLNFSDNSIKIVYGGFELSGCSPPPASTVCQGTPVSVGIGSNGSDYHEYLNARQVAKGAGPDILNPIPFTQSIRGSGCYLHDERSIPVGTTFTWLPGKLFPPKTYKASSIEASSATLKWNKVAEADSYEYIIRKASENFQSNWPSTGTVVPDTVVNLTGLQADTVYQLAVRSKKGSYESEWRYFENTFTTPCNTTSLPYVADFAADIACMKVVKDSASGIGWGAGSMINEFDYGAAPVGSWFFSKRLTLNAGTTYRVYLKYSGNTYGSRTLDNNIKVQMSRGYDDTLNLVSSPVINVPLLFADNGRIGLDTFMLFTPAVSGTYTVAFYAMASRALGFAQVNALEVFDNAVMNTFPCPTLLSPANNSVQPLFNNLILNWTDVPKTTKYYYYITDSAYYGNNTTFDENSTLSPGSYSQYTGVAGNRYDWYVIPRVYGSRLEGCSTNVYMYRMENPAVPANDLCSNAASLTVSSGFCSQPQKGSLINSTFSSSSDTTGNCMPAHGVPEDVWYKITVPATGNAVIQLSRYNNNTATNMSIMAFSGSCGSLTRIACAYNDKFSFVSDTASYICRMPITGRTPGETIFIRVSTASRDFPGFGIVTDSKSYFTIGAFDNSTGVMPAIATVANTCNGMQSTVIDSASGKLYMWVPLLAANGDIIGEVHPAGSPLGTVTGGAYVNTGALRSTNGVAYLDRNITITPSALKLKDNFSKVWVRLYAKQNEINTYNTAANNNTIGTYKINKNTDNCAATFVNPGNAELPVTDSARYNNDYIIGTATTSFSSFYLFKGGVGLPLPLKLIAFNATAKNGNALLSWITSNEINLSHFEIERSSDGLHFSSIGKSAVPAGSGEKLYSFTDNNMAPGINYYRLRMIDTDGKFSYSRTVKLNAGSKYSISILPNPAHNYFIISGADAFTNVSITDASGKLIRKMKKQSGNWYDVSNLSKGVYLVHLSNGKEAVVNKLVIE